MHDQRPADPGASIRSTSKVASDRVMPDSWSPSGPEDHGLFVEDEVRGKTWADRRV